MLCSAFASSCFKRLLAFTCILTMRFRQFKSPERSTTSTLLKKTHPYAYFRYDTLTASNGTMLSLARLSCTYGNTGTKFEKKNKRKDSWQGKPRSWSSLVDDSEEVTLFDICIVLLVVNALMICTYKTLTAQDISTCLKRLVYIIEQWGSSAGRLACCSFWSGFRLPHILVVPLLRRSPLYTFNRTFFFILASLQHDPLFGNLAMVPRRQHDKCPAVRNDNNSFMQNDIILHKIKISFSSLFTHTCSLKVLSCTTRSSRCYGKQSFR